MFPEQIAKPDNEHSQQVALFAWVAVAKLFGFDVADTWARGVDIETAKAAHPGYSPRHELDWFHAIPNGGSRGDTAKARMIRGAALKAEGVKTGVADTFLPWPTSSSHGLYIEMKKPAIKPVRAGAKGGLSDDQEEFRDYARNVGYGWVVCYSWREAADMLRKYVEWG